MNRIDTIKHIKGVNSGRFWICAKHSDDDFHVFSLPAMYTYDVAKVVEGLAMTPPFSDIITVKGCMGMGVVRYREFNPEHHDTIDWGLLAQQVEHADPIKHEDGWEKSIFIGVVQSLTPSTKVYTPWATSNVTPCLLCRGSGYVKNILADSSAFDRALDRRQALTEICKKEFGMFSQWSLDKQAEAKELDDLMDWSKEKSECAYCFGVGSREAYEDGLYWEYMEDRANDMGLYIAQGLGDPLDIYVGKQVEPPKDIHGEED
jgi:hypothetical protein